MDKRVLVEPEPSDPTENYQENLFVICAQKANLHRHEEHQPPKCKPSATIPVADVKMKVPQFAPVATSVEHL